MSKINSKRASFFDAHKKVETLYFTSDDRASFSEGGAKNNAAALKKRNLNAVVDTVTRAEVAAWRSEGATEHTITKEDLDSNPELTEVGIKEGDVVELPKMELHTDGETPTATGEETRPETAQESLEAAQRAYDAAVKSEVADDIITAKKVLSSAKARVTRESKK